MHVRVPLQMHCECEIINGGVGGGGGSRKVRQSTDDSFTLIFLKCSFIFEAACQRILFLHGLQIQL